MEVGAFLWIDLIAAAGLAVWIVAVHPNVGPRSVGWALLAFLVGQVIPTLGLALVPPVLRVRHGLELAFVGLVLPMFVVMFLTTVWLMRACIGPAGGPRFGLRREVRR